MQKENRKLRSKIIGPKCAKIGFSGCVARGSDTQQVPRHLPERVPGKGSRDVKVHVWALVNASWKGFPERSP